MLGGLLMVLLFLTSFFLVLLVLVQRGRGGGLAGAFGGLGGQSAFGTKAGDLFTRITIVTATFWIILCAFSVKYFSDSGSSILAPDLGGSNAATAPAATGAATQDATGKPGATTGGEAAEAGASGASPATDAADTPAPQSGASEKGK